MKRVMVIGGPGSGKSTLARALDEITGLPVYHMDLLHWKPGWVECDRNEKIALALETIARPKWIFEGGMSATYSERVARADTLVFLDLPLTQRLWRVVKRRIQYRGGQTRPDLPKNCPERLDPEFLSWILKTARKNQARDAQLLAEATHCDRFHLQSSAQVARFLSDCRALSASVATG